MGKCCPFFWVIRWALLVPNPSRSSPCFKGLVQKRVWILSSLCLYGFRWVASACFISWLKIMGLGHLQLSGNRSCRFYWEMGSVLAVSLLVVCLVCPFSSPLSASSFVLLLLSPPWLAPRNRRVHIAVSFSSLSRRLDDATLLPPPPSPNDPFVGKR